MIKIILAIFLALCFFTGTTAQEEEKKPVFETLKGDTTIRDGHLQIMQDKRIGALLDKDSRIEKDKGTFAGFRVQVFFGSGVTGKKRANEIKAEFSEKYPDIPVYIQYAKPNFKVRVGDCRTRLEAEKLRDDVLLDYPSTYVVRDEIRPPLPQSPR